MGTIKKQQSTTPAVHVTISSNRLQRLCELMYIQDCARFSRQNVLERRVMAPQSGDYTCSRRFYLSSKSARAFRPILCSIVPRIWRRTAFILPYGAEWRVCKYARF